MRSLQEQLDDLIKRKGNDDPMVQVLRNQITAEKNGTTFKDLYTVSAHTKLSIEQLKPSLMPMLSQDQWQQGLRVGDELRISFERVTRELSTKRRTALFYSAVADLSACVDESVIFNFGDRIGDGLPIDYVQMYISEQGMADMLVLKDEDLELITPADKVKFARGRLKSLQCDMDADICPGFWLVPITDGQCVIYLGYSITGYSFSGIEWKDEGAFLAKQDFISYVCCHREMLFEGNICSKGKATSIENISDSMLLKLLWGK